MTKPKNMCTYPTFSTKNVVLSYIHFYLLHVLYFDTKECTIKNCPKYFQKYNYIFYLQPTKTQKERIQKQTNAWDIKSKRFKAFLKKIKLPNHSCDSPTG